MRKMEGGKKIDRLFQEKLKDFEVTPSPLVWKNIEQKLNKKKKRRVLPIWIWTGTAASVAILVFLFTLKTETKNQNPEKIDLVTVEKEHQKVNNKQKTNTSEVTSIEVKDIKNKKTSQPEHQKPNIVNKRTKPYETEKHVNKSENVIVMKTQKNNVYETKIAANNRKTLKKKVFEGSYKPVNIKSNVKENLDDSKIAMTKKTLIKTNDRLNATKINNKISGGNSKVAMIKNSVNQQTKEKLKKKRKEKKKLLKEPLNNEEIAENKTLNSKWTIQPTFGVLVAKSYGKGSAIDSRFNDNKISGKNTQSYGLKVSYQINKKWILQSGVHLQELEFSTKNIVVSSGVLSLSSSSNITENIDSEPLEMSSPTPKKTNESNKSAFIYLDNNLNTNNGSLNQRYGYLEIPIEVKYAFLNGKKLNFNTVTGFSSLILSKNQIALENKGTSNVFGEAINLNPVNFSINLGLDLNYSLNNKLNFNVSPMFKTPINTFSKNSNGFKPYYIGVYTGIRYRF